MKCPRCQAETPSDAEFCPECGAKLTAVCAQCGTANAPGHKFCKKCGQPLSPTTAASPVAAPKFASPETYTPAHLTEKILTSRSALEGERKQVTVLFCDLANSTALAERLGPEAMHTLLNAFFELALAEVHRYEGTINQFLGDGFMALFGAPLAHEDHGRRAILAALGIQQRLKEPPAALGHPHGAEFAVRMGLNTGLVVVGKIGANLRMDYTAVGDTSNLAARLQQLADPGTILVSASTARLVGKDVELEARGPVAVKGKADPVPVYRLLGARALRSRFESLAPRGLTGFVGRDPELEQVLSAWAQAKQGQGRVVSVVGEAGIGKSRLLYEFRRHLAQEEARSIEGSCFAYGDVISYLPFLEIVKALFDLEGTESEAERKLRIGRRLASLPLDPSAVMPYLHNLVALPVEDELFPKLPSHLIRQRTVEALKALVLAEATRHPLVLILEDLHWMDKATEEVVGAIVESMAPVPLLLVLAYRPEYVHAWGDKAYQTQIPLSRLPSATSSEMVRAILTKPYAAQVAVERLSPEQSQALVQDLMGTATLPHELEQLIATKTEGNPFFVEELTRSLLESGTLVREDGGYRVGQPLEALDLPTTVQGVLLTRIDRLNEVLKEVLQVAAVIGRVFSFPVLADVVAPPADLDQVLLQLEDLEFLYPTSLAPQREYSFKHVLTQEAVYSTLLRPKREAHHEQIGQTIEALYPDRLEEYYEVLAYHYVRSANTQKAVQYLDLANQKAAKANAVEEAKTYFDQAMALLNTLPETVTHQQRRISLLVNQGWVINALLKFPEYYDLLTRYESTAVGLGHPGLVGAFYARMAWSEWSFGNFDRAIQTATKAAELCEAAGNHEDAGQAYVHWQWSYLYKGDYDQALALKDSVLRALARRFNVRWYLFAVTGASLACSWLGRWEHAVEEGQKALKMGEESSDNSVTSFAAWTLAVAYISKGDRTRALEYADLAVQKAPTPADKMWSQCFLAWVQCRAGEPRRGGEILAQAVVIQRVARFIASEVVALLLGEVYWLMGEYDNARHTLGELVEIAGRCGMKFHVGSAHRLLGEIARETNPTQVAEPLPGPHFERSIAILREVKAENELALAYAGYGRLQKQQGEVIRAREYLTKALEIFERLGTLLEPDKVRQALAELEGPNA